MNDYAQHENLLSLEIFISQRSRRTFNRKSTTAERNIQRTTSHILQKRKISKKTYLSEQNSKGQRPITSRNSGSRA